MATNFRTATASLSPNLDTQIAGSATQQTINYGSDVTVRCGMFAKGASKVRGLTRFSFDGIAGTEASAIWQRQITSVTEVAGTYSIFRIIQSTAILLVESEVTDLVVNATPTAWPTLRTDTDGAGAGPGHSTTATNKVTGLAFSSTPAEVLQTDVSLMVQDAIDDIVANAYTGSDAVFCLLSVHDNETSGTNGQSHVTASKEAAVSGTRPLLLLSYKPIDADTYLDNSPRALRISGRIVKLFAFAGAFTFAAGDELTFEYGTDPALAGASETDPIDLEAIAEGTLVADTVTFPGVATTVYFRAKIVENGVTSYDAIQSLDLSATRGEMPGTGVLASISATRAGCDETTEAHVCCTTDKAFDPLTDFAYVLHGETSGALDSASDPVPLQAAERDSFELLLTSLDISNREYYRVVVNESGVETQTGEHQISNIPDSGSVTVLYTADEHINIRINEIADPTLIDRIIASRAPATAAMQIHALTKAAMLAETAADGGKPHAQFKGGDWSQAHLTEKELYPMGADGLRSSPTSTHFLSQQDADYAVADAAQEDETLRDIQCIAVIPSNHGANRSYDYGKDWDGVTKSPAVVGRNTLDPEIDLAGWHHDALTRIVGHAHGAGIVTGDPLGRWGYVDIGPTRYIWIDPYLNSILSSTDPDDLPNTMDLATDWTIGAIADFLFNASTGAYRTCTLPHIKLLTHQFTSTAETGGPTNYGWSGWRIASPKGIEPSGEWAGAADWQAADPYSYDGSGTTWKQELFDLGVHRCMVKHRPATAITVVVHTFHAHFPLFERPHDGIFHVQHGRPMGGNDDTFYPGPHSMGHLVATGGSPPPPGGDGVIVSYDPDDELYRSNNAGFMREDSDETSSTLTWKKIYSSFEGQFWKNGTTPIVPESFEPGGEHNIGPNAVTTNNVVGFRLTLAGPDHPIASIVDSFGDDCVIEDTVAQVTAGTEQDPLNEGEANRRIASNLGAHWKNYSSNGSTFLAVRDSIITPGTNVLSSKRPEAAGAAAVVQQIRRALTPVNRRVRVSVRTPTTGAAGYPITVQIAGADVDYDPLTPTDEGLCARIDCVGTILLVFRADNDETLIDTIGSAISCATDFQELDVTRVGRTVKVTFGGVLQGTYTLTQEQSDWLDAAGHNWTGVAGETSNNVLELPVVEFLGFSAGVASAGGGRSRGRHRGRGWWE